MDDIGQKLYQEYVAERINGDVSLWTPVMFTSNKKRHAVKVCDKTIDMKKTKDLYDRLMVLARSSWDVDQKEAIGIYEFTLTPRARFVSDGSVLPCTDKPKIIHLLELLKSDKTAQHDSLQHEPLKRTISTQGRGSWWYIEWCLFRSWLRNQLPWSQWEILAKASMKDK